MSGSVVSGCYCAAEDGGCCLGGEMPGLLLRRLCRRDGKRRRDGREGLGFSFLVDFRDGFGGGYFSSWWLV